MVLWWSVNNGSVPEPVIGAEPAGRCPLLHLSCFNENTVLSAAERGWFPECVRVCA